MQQYTARRIDTQPREEFGITQRQLDHFAQLLDRIRHPAKVIISNIGTPALFGFGKFGTQLNLGVVVDIDNALGNCRNHGEADFCQRERRRREHLSQLRRHVIRGHTLLAVGRNNIASCHRSTQKTSL